MPKGKAARSGAVRMDLYVNLGANVVPLFEVCGSRMSDCAYDMLLRFGWNRLLWPLTRAFFEKETRMRREAWRGE